jgi:GAF domain-containing protein
VPREQQLADAFVELAGTLVAGSDVVEFLHILARRSVDLLDAAEAGLMLADERGGLRVMASSNERAHLLELFELQSDEGPCLDCYRSGQPLVNEWLDENPGRWPRFSVRARALGFRSAHALPMRWQSEVIGSLNLFRDDAGSLSDADVAMGQALADVATIGILQERTLREARVVSERMQAALSSRVVIEQAKGMVAARGDVSIDEAFELLRRYARNTNSRLHDVAEAAIEGRLGMRDFGWPLKPPEGG